MKISHDREHREHLRCSSRGLPPILPAEGDLGDLLPGTEAIIDGTTPKAPLSEARVNAAMEVRLQIGTSLPSVFIDREVYRG
jgi:hypothetical protein